MLQISYLILTLTIFATSKSHIFSLGRENIAINVIQTQTYTEIRINGASAWKQSFLSPKPSPSDPFNLKSRGLMLLTINPFNGKPQHTAVASGWMTHDTSHSLRQLVEESRDIDILLFFTHGEIGPTIHMQNGTSSLLEKLGAKKLAELEKNDCYFLVCKKNGNYFFESYVHMSAIIDNNATDRTKVTNFSVTIWPESLDYKICTNTTQQLTEDLENFCLKYSGYGDLCHCGPPQLPLTEIPLKDSNMSFVPIIIIAGNRPQSLWKSIRSLFKSPGTNRRNILVFVDGLYTEVVELCKLINIQCISINNRKVNDTTLRIRNHYENVFKKTFERFITAKKALFLEEDLLVSPDIISYFSQTSHLLDLDPSLWCISAWNDNAFEITSSDATTLYRVSYMPGLGWMMNRKTIEELRAKWPKKGDAYDWDVWVRWKNVTRGRECVVPDVSRTYHMSSITSRHIENNFQTLYYEEHPLNTITNVQLNNVDNLLSAAYEEHIKQLLRRAKPLEAKDIYAETKGDSVQDCAAQIGGTSYDVYAVFFQMDDYSDTKMFKTMARCFGLWDLDLRGEHNGMWRFTYYDRQVLMFAIPMTSYIPIIKKYYLFDINVIQPFSDIKKSEIQKL